MIVVDYEPKPISPETQEMLDRLEVVYDQLVNIAEDGDDIPELKRRWKELLDEITKEDES